MTLAFIDSFDHYATTDLTQKYNGATGGTIGAYGRNSTNGLRNANTVYKTLGAYQEWIVGMAYKQSSGNTKKILVLRDSSLEQLRFLMTGSNNIKAQNGANSDLGTTVAALTNNVWHYLEFYALIDTTVGVVKIKIDGAEALSLTGVDTTGLGSDDSCDNVAFGTDTMAADIDDVYVKVDEDDSGFLGDVRIEFLLPTADTANVDWATSAGSDHYALVNENPPDDDTSYVYASGVDLRDIYEFGNLVTTSGSIYGVQVSILARKDDAGAKTIVSVVASGVNIYDDTDDKNLADTYKFYHTVYEDNPHTGSSWLIPDVNSSDFGMKITS